MKISKQFKLTAAIFATGAIFVGGVSAQSETARAETAAKPEASFAIPTNGKLMHVDPLDEARAGAMHRGPNPHAKLTPEQHIEVALKHFREGRLPQAMAALDQAIVKYPNAAELYNVRSSLDMASDDTSRALADIEQAVKLKPDDALYHVARAQIYLKFEREKEAMADLNKAVKLNPELVPARFNRGTLLAYQGENTQALDDFDHCVAVQPHLPAPYFNRGSLYYQLGEKQKARADIERFIQIASVDSWKKAGKDLLKAWDKADGKLIATNKPGDAK